MGGQISSNKDVRELVRWAEDLGYSAERTKGGHIRMVHPDVPEPVFCPSTPSEYRSIKNVQAVLVGKLSRSVNEKLKADPELVSVFEGVVGIFDCPACLGNGVTKSFTHPQGLIAHMSKEHPAPELDWNPEEEDQLEEDMAEPSEDLNPVRVKELESYLEEARDMEDLKSGEYVSLSEIREYFGDRDVSNAIVALKKRQKGIRLETSPKYGKYTFLAPEPEESEVEVPAVFEESRIYEEINRFVDGRVLLRDADGHLYQAEIDPLT